MMAHRLAAAGAALAVVLGGVAVFWWPELRDRLALSEEVRAAAGGDGSPGEGRSEMVRLAFLAPDGRTLEEETREVLLRPSPPAAARGVLEELQAGSRQGRGPVFPPGARVRQVFVDKRGVAYVDLSPEVLGDPGAADPWATVVRAALAVAASVGMSIPEIAQVQVLVDGREIPVVADGVDLRRPLPAALPAPPQPPHPTQ